MQASASTNNVRTALTLLLASDCVAKRKKTPVIYLRVTDAMKAKWDDATDGRNIPQSRAGEALVAWFLRQSPDKQLEIIDVRKPTAVTGRSVELEPAPAVRKLRSYERRSKPTQ